MTDQHTFESLEYTQDELIAALRKLGAEIKKHTDAFGDKYLSIRLPGKSFTFSSLVEASTFLRANQSAWMAMDDVLRKIYVSNLWGDDFFEYTLDVGNYRAFFGKGATRQEAVYDCFMQFIREELKK